VPLSDLTKKRLTLVCEGTAVLVCNALYLMILPDSIKASPRYWACFVLPFGTLGAVGTAYEEVSKAKGRRIIALVAFITYFFFILGKSVDYGFMTVAAAFFGWPIGALIVEVVKCMRPGMFLRWYVTKRPPWR